MYVCLHVCMNVCMYVCMYVCMHAHIYVIWAGIAQLVYRLATGWTVQGSKPGGGEIFRTVQTGPVAHPASCTMGTGSLSRG